MESSTDQDGKAAVALGAVMALVFTVIFSLRAMAPLVPPPVLHALISLPI